jgi:hypothetical protein
MHEPIHIGNQTKLRKVTSAIAVVVIAPIAILAGAITWYYRRKDRQMTHSNTYQSVFGLPNSDDMTRWIRWTCNYADTAKHPLSGSKCTVKGAVKKSAVRTSAKLERWTCKRHRYDRLDNSFESRKRSLECNSLRMTTTLKRTSDQEHGKRIRRDRIEPNHVRNGAFLTLKSRCDMSKCTHDRAWH